jgi:hypothetical protein
MLAGSDILIWDFARKSLTPLTPNAAGLNAVPVWTPGGDAVIFASRPRGFGSPSYLFRAAVDANKAPTRISPKDVEALSGSAGQEPGSVSTDGADLFFAQVGTRERACIVHLGASQTG